MAGQLHGEAADPTGRPMDQYPLTSRELCAIDERLPRGECRDRYGSRLSMIKHDRLRRNVSRNGHTIFCLGAVYEPIVQSIDEISNSDACTCRPNHFNDAGEFMA